MPFVDTARSRGIRSGKVDVGRLFVDTKKIYLEARAKSVETEEPLLRIHTMYAIVKMLGHLIQQIKILRNEITQGEEGLKGFDADLAGLTRRYRNLYKPFFEDLPPPEEWTAEDWTSFEEDLEGPILFWDLKTCSERWGIPFGTPQCEGPDLLMGLSLLHQTGVAMEFQQELIASLYGIADLTMNEFLEFYGDLGKAAGKAVAAGLAGIAGGIKDYVVSGSTGGFAWGLGVAAAVGAGGYFLLKKRKESKRNGH